MADHDSAGITAAKKTGFITRLTDAEGEDFNDYELRVGAQVAGESLSSRISMVNPE